MTDILLIAVIVAFFAAAGLLVKVIDGMIAGASEQDGTASRTGPSSSRGAADDRARHPGR